MRRFLRRSAPDDWLGAAFRIIASPSRVCVLSAVPCREDETSDNPSQPWGCASLRTAGRLAVADHRGDRAVDSDRPHDHATGLIRAFSRPHSAKTIEAKDTTASCVASQGSRKRRSSESTAALGPTPTSTLVHRMCEVIRHRGPDDEGIHVEPGRRARHAAAEHHRSLDGPPADPQRRSAPSGSSSTARSTTTASCAASSKPPDTASTRPATPSRSSTPTSNGARTPSRRLRGMFGIALWDRTADGRCCSRAIAPASSRCTSSSADRSAVFRIGDQVAARRRRGRSARDRSRSARSLPFVSLRAPRSLPLQVASASCRRGTSCAGATAAPTSSSTGRSQRRRPFRGTADDAASELRDGARGRGAVAHGQRRAARRVPVGRRRLEQRRRADGRGLAASPSRRSPSASTSRSSTSSSTRGRSPSTSAPSITSSWCARTGCRSSID